MLFEGGYGTGKTHLAAAIGNYRLIKGENVLFITTPDLLDHLRSSFAPNADTTYNELFDRVRNTDLLILDDLGIENPSEWAKEKLFQLFNHRYSHRMQTVITTNADLENLDARIRSRLMDIDIIHRVALRLPDYRSNLSNSDQGNLLSRLAMYSGMTFETFEYEVNAKPEEREELSNALKKAEYFALNYDDMTKKWFVLYGDFGTGKTHLAAAIANHCRSQNQDVLFLTVPDLLDYLRTAFEPDSQITFDKLFNQIRSTSLLVLDDLGTESARPWAQEKLFQILDYRYVGQLPTVITLSKRLDQINPRIVSRLTDQRICNIIDINVRSHSVRIKRS